LRFNSVGRVPIYMKDKSIKKIMKIDDVEASYYIRISCIDKPGVLARVAGILGRHGISIASVGQKERRKARIVPVVMMTHEAKEKNMRQALEEIDRISAIRRKTVAIRVER
ncbi:MAG: ACT domain-containing protein, partial [Candidatus Omnitrophica bacterium]|nr:ACT domain-containing protein [Candidatus Omnitrophota bacterium]